MRCGLAREVVKHPATELRPTDPDPDSRAAVCVGFAKDVCAELEIRKRRRGILGYDDLLTRLADALDADDSPAQLRMHQRWPIVMVDEFQDTDPVQWQVIDRAFTGRSTLILIGDPKQAIYAFRGGDIVTYLKAAETAGVRRRSARTGAATPHWSIGCRRCCAAPSSGIRGSSSTTSRRSMHGSRLKGAPCDDPFRLRVVRRETFGRSGTRAITIGDLRTHIPTTWPPTSASC